MSHELEKPFWTSEDFDVMGWHDAHFYCFMVLPDQVELNTGDIAFDASGYTQYFRREPDLTRAQSLGVDARGGLPFARMAYGT